MVDFASCMDDCQGQSSAAQYCQFVDTITPISYGGSIVCCDQYESAKPSQLSTAEEALWARVWFEVSSTFYKLLAFSVRAMRSFQPNLDCVSISKQMFWLVTKEIFRGLKGAGGHALFI